MAEAAADRDREVQGVPQEQEAATRPVCRMLASQRTYLGTHSKVFEKYLKSILKVLKKYLKHVERFFVFCLLF